MSDTPDTLDGPSGPSPKGSVALPTPKKPWRAPLVIQPTVSGSTDKLYRGNESYTTTPIGPPS